MLHHILIRPLTPIHVGDGSLVSAKPTIPSSTITSAIISAMIELDILDQKELAEAMGNIPIIRASSMLPVSGNRVYVWVHGLNILFQHKLHELKKEANALIYSRAYTELSNIRLCDWSFLKSVIDGKQPLLKIERSEIGNVDVSIVIDDKKYVIVDTGIGGKALAEEGVTYPVFRRVTIARNIVDRISSTADIYYVAAVVPETNMLLYLDAPERILVKTEAALRLLEDKGIGGKRSSGYGRFRILGNGGGVAEELAYYMERSGSHGLIQGVYAPAPGEEGVLRESYYRTKIHRGRGGLTGIILSRVIYANEGSMISLRKARRIEGFAQPCIGRVVVDNVDGDTVIRHYTPIYIPLRIKNKVRNNG